MSISQNELYGDIYIYVVNIMVIILVVICIMLGNG